MLNDITQEGDVLVVGHTLASYIVGLIVDYAAMNYRAARHEREQVGKHIVIAPKPHLIVRCTATTRHRAKERLGSIFSSSNACYSLV